MLSGEQVGKTSHTDSCQTSVTSQEATHSAAIYTAGTVVTTPVRKTFEEQKPFIFGIVGFAALYIITLIIVRIVKNQLAR